MDYKTFIVEIVKAVAWPVLTGMTLYHFRNFIKRLVLVLARSLRGMQTVKVAGIELAQRALEPAVVSAENRAEEVREQLVEGSSLSPAEREELLVRLEKTVAEHETLKQAYQQLQRQQSGVHSKGAELQNFQVVMAVRAICRAAMLAAEKAGMSKADISKLPITHRTGFLRDAIGSGSGLYLGPEILDTLVHHEYLTPERRPTPRLRRAFSAYISEELVNPDRRVAQASQGEILPTD